jgi:hypothetical protein
MHRDIPRDDPHALERFSALVRGAAERGEREVLALRFPSKELEPQGYKLRAQIMDFPGGMPGDVGIFLRW